MVETMVVMQILLSLLLAQKLCSSLWNSPIVHLNSTTSFHSFAGFVVFISNMLLKFLGFPFCGEFLEMLLANELSGEVSFGIFW